MAGTTYLKLKCFRGPRKRDKNALGQRGLKPLQLTFSVILRLVRLVRMVRNWNFQSIAAGLAACHTPKDQIQTFGRGVYVRDARPK